MIYGIVYYKIASLPMNITIQKDPRISSADAFSCLRIDERSVTVGENNIPAIAVQETCSIYPTKMLNIGLHIC